MAFDVHSHNSSSNNNMPIGAANVYQHVLGLDVPMDELLLMQIEYRGYDVVRDEELASPR